MATIICRMRALQNYDAVADGELNVKRGDVIYVIEQSERFWWYGQLDDGSEGYFPVDYTEFIGDGDGSDAAAPSQDDAVALIRAAWSLCVQGPRRCQTIAWAVVVVQSRWRGVQARRLYKELTRRLNMDKIPQAETSTLSSLTRNRAAPTRTGAASGPSRRPPTRRAKIAIETKTSTEPDASSSPSAASSTDTGQATIRKTFGGPAVLTFDPTAVQLRKKADTPQRQAPAPAPVAAPFVGVQLRKTERPPQENAAADNAAPAFPTLRKTAGPRCTWAPQRDSPLTEPPQPVRPPPVGPPRRSNPPPPAETFQSAAAKGAAALSPPTLPRLNLRATVTAPLQPLATDRPAAPPPRPTRTAQLHDTADDTNSSSALVSPRGPPLPLPRRGTSATPGDVTQRVMMSASAPPGAVHPAAAALKQELPEHPLRPACAPLPPPISRPPPPAALPPVAADTAPPPAPLPRPVHPAAASMHQAGRTRQSVHPMAAALKQELPEHPLRPACAPLPPPILPRTSPSGTVVGTGPLRPVHPAAQAMQNAGLSSVPPRPVHPAAAALQHAGSSGAIVRSPSSSDDAKSGRRPPPEAPAIRATVDAATLRAAAASRATASSSSPVASSSSTTSPVASSSSTSPVASSSSSSSTSPVVSPPLPRTESDASARDIYAASPPPLAVRPGPSANGYHWEQKRERVGGYLAGFLETRPTSPEDMQQAAEKPVYVTPPVERLERQAAAPSSAAVDSLNTAALSPRRQAKEKRKTVFPFQGGAKACHACKKPFGILAAKVPCMSCSQVCCHKCTKNKIPIPGTANSRPQIVCDPCYRLILQTLSVVVS